MSLGLDPEIATALAPMAGAMADATPPAVGDVEARRAMWEPIIGAAGTAQPIPADVTTAAPPSKPHKPSEARSEVQQLLDSWGSTPAYVRDRCFDVLMANKAAVVLAPMYHPGRNLVRDVFLDPTTRRLFPDWQDIAEQTVAALRATADPRDPRTAALVTELQSHDEFRSLWDRHDVRPTRDEIKRFNHPDAGQLSLRRQTLTIAGAEDQVIIVYQPEPGGPSADALAKLL